MFIPLTEPERQAFMAQNAKSFIPGYTGHCPTLKFRFGRCYGANTKDIMQELREKGFMQSARKELYREDPRTLYLAPIKRSKDQTIDPVDAIRNKSARYILGYTGYIPGLNFRYGKSYSRSADDSMYEFNEKQNIYKKRIENDNMIRATSAPKMTSLRNKDEVAKALNDYEEKVKFAARTISPDFPPIAGYTGHIPRVKGNENSLSQRYYCVAKQGLSALYQDRNRRNEVNNVQDKIRNICNEQERKYDST